MRRTRRRLHTADAAASRPTWPKSLVDSRGLVRQRPRRWRVSPLKMLVAFFGRGPRMRPMPTHRRFDRTARLLGDEGIARLAASTVSVFGVGGVGSFAAEGLVRSGVGRVILCDYDRICVTNVNRQL